MKIRRCIIPAVLCLLSTCAAAAQDKVRLTVRPQAIGIGTFYNGTTVTATGSIPADSQAVVRFLGDRAEVHMKQKAKVGGVMWMNLDSVTIREAPSVCIVSSAVDFKDLDAGGAKVEGLRLTGLRQTIQIQTEGSRKLDIVGEFLKMKEKEGLYREISGNIAYGKPAKGFKTFRAVIPLPSRLSPGVYTIDAAAVRNGAIIARGQETMEAKLEGLPEFMASMAYNHAIVYGVFASLIAVLAGLGIGLVFESKGAH